MNKVILVGRLTRDPEVRYIRKGKIQWQLQDIPLQLIVDLDEMENQQQILLIASCLASQRNLLKNTLDRDLEWLFRDVSPLAATRIVMVSQGLYNGSIVVEEQEFAESKAESESNKTSNNHTQSSSQGYIK